MEQRNRGALPLSEKALLDAKSLAIYLDIGIATARKIGKEANAEVRFGKSVRYKTQKIDEFLKYL